MNNKNNFIILISILLISLNTVGKEIPQSLAAVLEKKCLDCHDSETEKGDIRLDNIAELSTVEQLNLINKIEEQVYLNQMPPKKKKALTKTERQQVLDWVAASFKKANAKSEFREKLSDPRFGNYVDHDLLFSGEIKQKAFTPQRRRLVSPYIFRNRIDRIIGKSQKLFGELNNPFLLPNNSGVRYYDNLITDSGHFINMLANANRLSYAQLGILSEELQAVNEERAVKLKEELKKLNESNDPQPLKDRKTSRLKITFQQIKPLAITYRSKKANDTPLHKIIEKDTPPSEKELCDAIEYQFSMILQRKPTQEELSEISALTREMINQLGNIEGLRRMLVTVIMHPEFIYRKEFGEDKTDQFGRRKLTDREAAFALSYALTEKDPDQELLSAAEKGKLSTKEDYKKQILRLLKPAKTSATVDVNLESRYKTSFNSRQIAKLRFFREFFGYYDAYKTFKDSKRFGAKYYQESIELLINDADLLVEHILKEDKDVFNKLLTTEKFYLYHPGDNKQAQVTIPKNKKIIDGLVTDYKKLPVKDFFKKNSRNVFQYLGLRPKGAMKDGAKLLKSRMDYIVNNPEYIYPHFYPAKDQRGSSRRPERTMFFNIDHTTWSYVPVQPFRIPNRKGMLTHPVWLIAHSHNTETDPVKRGKWIREKLLAGFIPDVPITVDAAIPVDHNKTLRDRLHSKTAEAACWKCHESMNPLGYPFEMYDDFGRYRTEEELEYPEHIVEEHPGIKNFTPNKYKTLPLKTDGFLQGSGNPKLDGPVNDAIDLIERLAKSDRVRQSIIRHAFRFYVGRNEMLSDSQTLIDADQAYLNSGGSFNAVIVSLLTSDSFMYRKEQ